MSPSIYKGTFSDSIFNPHGAGQVLQSGVLKIPILLDAWKKHLVEQDAFLDGPFNHQDLGIEPDHFEYHENRYKKVLFCEGVGVINNPWFNWLPIQQFKGEVLEIAAPQLELTRMINRGVFVLPLENGNFKVGSTHDWRLVDEIPTKEGREELTEKLDKILNVPYEVVAHEAGLRPATRDRHPYIGEHPRVPNMYICNGLGSKGVIMIPWLAEAFIKGIENQEWPKEFNITRYQRFYTE